MSDRIKEAEIGGAGRILVVLLLGALVAASFVLGPAGPIARGTQAGAPASAAGVRALAVARGGFETLREPAAAATGDADLAVPLATLAPTPAPTPATTAALATAAPVVRASAATPAPRPPTLRPVAPAPVAATGVAAAEQRMLGLMNASRAQAGIGALALDTGVSLTARAHSAAEAQVGYVYHDGPDGTARSRDATACGSGWYGENTGKVWNGNVDALHLEFMAEPLIPINHRTNIVDPAFKRVGVGAVQGPDALYLTMVFCR